MARSYPWAHERVLKLRDESIDEAWNIPGISKYDCKKLKGDHRFLLIKRVNFKILNGGYKEYKCIACGKLKHKGFD